MTTTSTGSLPAKITNGKGAFTAPYKIIGTGWTTIVLERRIRPGASRERGVP